MCEITQRIYKGVVKCLNDSEKNGNKKTERDNKIEYEYKAVFNTI